MGTAQTAENGRQIRIFAMYRYIIAIPLVLQCGPLTAAEKQPSSWGKQGITFDQYRSDAVECAQVGYYRDVAQDEPAKRFVRGFRTSDDVMNQVDFSGPNVDRWLDSELRTRPDQRMREVHAIQVADVEKCLSAKGYRKFVLSSQEAKALSKYPSGSVERHRFLHRLASR